MKRLSLFAALLFTAVLTTGCGSTWIDPGYVGIKVVASGNNKGEPQLIEGGGRVIYNPWNEYVFKYPTFTQNVVWTKNPNEGKKINEEISFTNRDKYPLSVDVNLSYQLDRTKVPAFYVKFRTDHMEDFTDGFMHSVARDAFNEVGGLYGIDDIMGDNAKFLADVRARLQAEVQPYGVNIVQFGLVDAPRPPAVVQAAINASATAKQNAIRVQNELASTQAEAMKSVAEAEGKAKARLAQAGAEAEANKMVANSISPTLVEYMKVQKWDGALPQVSGGSTPLINLSTK